MATRELIDLEYSLDSENSLYEQLTYNELSNWIEARMNEGKLDIESDIKPVLSSFLAPRGPLRQKSRN